MNTSSHRYELSRRIVRKYAKHNQRLKANQTLIDSFQSNFPVQRYFVASRQRIPCPFCNQNLSKLSLDSRQEHVEKCMETEGKRQNQHTYLTCRFCYDMVSCRYMLKHLKQCGLAHGIHPKHIVSFVRNLGDRVKVADNSKAKKRKIAVEPQHYIKNEVLSGLKCDYGVAARRLNEMITFKTNQATLINMNKTVQCVNWIKSFQQPETTELLDNLLNEYSKHLSTGDSCEDLFNISNKTIDNESINEKKSPRNVDMSPIIIDDNSVRISAKCDERPINSDNIEISIRDKTNGLVKSLDMKLESSTYLLNSSLYRNNAFDEYSSNDDIFVDHVSINNPDLMDLPFTLNDRTNYEVCDDKESQCIDFTRNNSELVCMFDTRDSLSSQNNRFKSTINDDKMSKRIDCATSHLELTCHTLDSSRFYNVGKFYNDKYCKNKNQINSAKSIQDIADTPFDVFGTTISLSSDADQDTNFGSCHDHELFSIDQPVEINVNNTWIGFEDCYEICDQSFRNLANNPSEMNRCITLIDKPSDQGLSLITLDDPKSVPSEQTVITLSDISVPSPNVTIIEDDKISSANKHDIDDNHAYRHNTIHASTPLGKKFKIVYKEEYTPLPNYDEMSTPRLRRELSQIGMKHNFAKKRMMKTLQNVYKLTHQYETDKDETVTDVDDECENEEQSDAAFQESLYENSADNNSLDEFQIHILQLKELLSSNDEMYKRILVYEPIRLQEIMDLIKAHNLKLDQRQIMLALDFLSITFTLDRKTKQQRRRKPKTAK
ncbi:hypothetical protein GJ496_009083 [Pomphorhynchus laevis]|nr:hypothetical protein GJ496_009083 [Pomphorhynchus laevis]